MAVSDHGGYCPGDPGTVIEGDDCPGDPGTVIEGDDRGEVGKGMQVVSGTIEARARLAPHMGGCRAWGDVRPLGPGIRH